MPRPFRITACSAAALLLTAAGALVSVAGPLNPPSGAVSSSFKTLSEVEPRIAINQTNTPGASNSIFTITQPGSYYLTGNIVGQAGKHGIVIAANGVTLDLNGFELIGVENSQSAVEVALFLSNISVRNGAIRDWGASGLDMSSGINSRVSDIRVSQCGANGVYISSNATVERCNAFQNDGTGIYLVGNGLVSNCISSGNGIAGFVLSGGTILDCEARNNGSDGVNGSSECTVMRCALTANVGNGVNIGGGSTVADCTIGRNTLNGIRIAGDSLVLHNNCDSNGWTTGDGAGILVTGNDTRVEGNNCTDNDRGVDIDGANNVIIRNTCASNTIDWSFVANNVFGPIIDRRSPGSAAVSGFSAASTLGSTDGNANISY